MPPKRPVQPAQVQTRSSANGVSQVRAPMRPPPPVQNIVRSGTVAAAAIGAAQPKTQQQNRSNMVRRMVPIQYTQSMMESDTDMEPTNPDEYISDSGYDTSYQNQNDGVSI